MLVHHGMGQLFVFLICVLTTTAESSIYEVLKAHGLPKGLLPKGVKNFTLDNSGNFMVHLDEACNAKIVNEFHYERNVSGRLSYGEINSLSGISAKDLFLWIQVKKIYVTDSGSGVIYFDCGVVDKQFSLSSFENPEDCVAADLDHLFQTVSKSQSRKLQYKLDQGT